MVTGIHEKLCTDDHLLFALVPTSRQNNNLWHGKATFGFEKFP
jgi:hypothetical protein